MVVVDVLMLSVIGLGYPRTGTMSLKHALETLQLGRCYHMIEVFNRPGDAAFWNSAIDKSGEEVDWNTVFEGFTATVDCPACYFWKPLRKQYPSAKVILTVRDSGVWYDSFRATVYEAMMHPENSPDESHRSVQKMARRLIHDIMLDGRFLERDFAIATYEAHNQQIIDAVPAAQLLVFNVADGWPPLCEFLDVDAPEVEFPQSNTREEFQHRFAVLPPT